MWQREKAEAKTKKSMKEGERESTRQVQSKGKTCTWFKKEKRK